MRRHPSGKPRPITYPLNNPRRKRRAVQLAHLLRHADVRVHKRFVVDDHELVRCIGVGRLLEPVGLSPEEMRPDVNLDEVQEGDDVQWTQLRARGFAEEEEVEEFEAYGMALEVESEARFGISMWTG